MFNKKTALLVATLLAGVATSAHAQTALPAPGPNDGDASLHGTGASSISNVLVRELNCIGVNNQLGNSGATSGNPSGSLSTRSAGLYSSATLPFNCATTDVQPNFSGKYVATGSGFGRRMWYQFKDNFDGSPTNGVVNTFNPFNTVAGQGRWSHVQFAFSDSSPSPAELTLYQTGGTDSVTGTFAGAQASAGRAINIPLYILPVAIAYNPIYGKNASNVNMTFNARYTGSINGLVSPAIRMTRQLYCRIFNGDITNWNDPAFAPLNQNVSLQDPVNDTTTRWNADGVPIRLVGRMDNSGTTDVFTRHLAAACNSLTVTTNKYLKNADNLPYNPAPGAPDYRTRREDTNYFPGSSASRFAGTTNMVSGTFWNGTTQTFDYIGAGASAQPTGNQGTGLYIVANGGGQVAAALNAAPDLSLNGVTLNGRVGYNSADFVPPSVDNANLSYALLQVGNTTAYAPPSIASAVKAFGKGATALVPPQSTSTGAWLTTDTRQVRNVAGALVNATRDNPLAWTDVLYVPTGGNTLSAPLDGYPIVGTAQFLGYSCYTPTNRAQIVEFLALTLGKITKNSANAAIDGKLFNNTSATTPGVLVQSNIGTLPSAWATAITETFLKKSTQVSNLVKLSDQNLWIQNKYLLSATKSPGDLLSNPTCSGLPGA